MSQVPPKRRGQVVPQKRGRHRFPLFILITMAHFVYIIYSKSVDKFYVGETLNVAKRFEQHNSGFYKAAFSKQTTDWKLFWAVECNSRRQALKLEKFIKNMKSRYFKVYSIKGKIIWSYLFPLLQKSLHSKLELTMYL